MSKEHNNFIKKYKRNKLLIFFIQFLIVFLLLFSWEVLSTKGIINSFIFSRPSKIIKEIYSLYSNNNLFCHIFTTLFETILAFFISVLLSIIISILFYLYKPIYNVFEPFLTIFNSLPKVALGPMIIIICGANIKSVVMMAILINIIVSCTVITVGFYNTDTTKIKLMKSFKANKYQILKYLVIPNSYNTIISSFKLSISMCLIGVISGEFLVSKSGIGYLIIYGTQIFNMNLVISGILILLFISFLLYKIIEIIEKKIIK